ncbi:zinc finger protein [Sordaria sp. MPI-SDFR-AT-0083]|nr:zinc finger protein [Sordaria sp. MPI-SDFR-AT-0083]
MAPVSLTPQYPAQPYGFAPPPSPPLDDSNKCSLPSISNLLVMADQGSPTSETSPQSQQCMAGRPILIPGNCAETNHFSVHFSKSDNRPNSSQFGNPASVRANLPPSPPMSSEASFEGYHSPSSKPTSQSQGSSNYYYETTPPLSQHEADSRQMATAAPRAPVQPSTFQSQYPSPAGYSSQSGINPYYPPMQPTPPPQQQMPALYYQRPLPQTFTPSVPVSVTLAPATGANPWQHHHYIAPSSTASFPQSQDRYICQTCNKAFSRPSSLRIHSHSHTGEKPFKCPHAGCGKAFSVRSNMKRHERGCHSFESSNSNNNGNSNGGAAA